MENNYFVFKIKKRNGFGYNYGIYNKEHDKWALNIVFQGTFQECKSYKEQLKKMICL